MTVIVGLVEEDRVHIGGDSAGISGCKLTVRKDPKVFRNGPYALGFCGSFRMWRRAVSGAPAGRSQWRHGDLVRYWSACAVDDAGSPSVTGVALPLIAVAGRNTFHGLYRSRQGDDRS